MSIKEFPIDPKRVTTWLDRDGTYWIANAYGYQKVHMHRDGSITPIGPWEKFEEAPPEPGVVA